MGSDKPCPGGVPQDETAATTQGLENPVGTRLSDGLPPVLDAQLAVDALEVRLDRVRREGHVAGDLADRAQAAELGDHVAFSQRQGRPGRRPGGRTQDDLPEGASVPERGWPAVSSSFTTPAKSVNGRTSPLSRANLIATAERGLSCGVTAGERVHGRLDEPRHGVRDGVPGHNAIRGDCGDRGAGA